MLSHTYAPELADVLVAFFFWLSLFVCLTALVVFGLIGVSVYRLVKEPARTRRTTVPAQNPAATVLSFPSACYPVLLSRCQLVSLVYVAAAKIWLSKSGDVGMIRGFYSAG